MDLALEKQKIKQEIDKLNDETILGSIKKLLGLAKEKQFTSLTKEDLIARALESEKAIREKRFTSIEELEKEVEFLKYVMEEKGLKQTDLVKYIGSKSTVSQILNRKRSMTVDMIRKLSAGLSIPVDGFAGV